MRIMLVNPPAYNIQEPMHDTPEYYHLGMAHLYAHIYSNTEHNVIFTDCRKLRIDRKRLLDEIRCFSPDILGITARTMDIRNVTDILKKAKDLIPGIRTVIGGAHASARAEQLSKLCYIDNIIVGEGENAFLNIINSVSSGQKISRIVYGTSGEITPVPWERFRPCSHYYIHATRGCPGKCIFCMRVLGDDIHRRNIDDVVKEIDKIYSINSRAVIEFADETLTWDKKYAESIFDAIIKKGIRPRLVLSTRVDCMDEYILSSMKKAGVEKVIVGVESGDRDILRRAAKGITPEKALSAVRMIKRAGMSVETNFIVGLPGEDVISVLKTAVLAGRMAPDNISVSIAVPYPGTELFDMTCRSEYGLRFEQKDFSVFNNELGNALSTEKMPRIMLEISQLFIYVMSFMVRFRIKEFIKFTYQYRKEAVSFMANILKRFSRDIC